nr:store-operated calcium entry-associated regulatory factor [Quercus suber]
MRALGCIVSLILSFLSTSLAARKPANSILLSQVKSLTLRDGQQTSHRRVASLPQLKCVGGSGKGLYTVDVMRCQNAGSEYDTEDIQWTCKASLPPEFKLGSTEVICEGYDSPDDPYVLKGSCGVEYRLVLTDQGEAKYGSNSWERMFKKKNQVDDKSESSLGSMLFATVFWIAFAGGPNRRRGWGGFGGGGGPDDGNDPPPPYTPRVPKPAASYRANQAPRSSAAGGGWQPGFWTGTAAGAAAGYLAGNRGNGRQNANRYYQDPQPGPANWFGGGRPRDSMDWGGGSPSAGPSSAPSSSRYASTGFGGTRRR